MKNFHYIIMADIIGSRELPTDFMDQFHQLADHANAAFKDHILSPLTITLGDEFQGIVADPATLFNLLFYLDEYSIKNNYGFHLRYSLVYGEIQTEVNPKIAHEMYGLGLTKAREALTTIKESNDRFHLDLRDKTNEQLSLCLRLYQSITSEWKSSDYPVIAAFLTYKDYKTLQEIGLYKTTSGPWKKRKTLRIEEYSIVKELIFAILSQ